MREAGTTGQSLVRALEQVADDYGIVELEQAAHSRLVCWQHQRQRLVRTPFARPQPRYSGLAARVDHQVVAANALDRDDPAGA